MVETSLFAVFLLGLFGGVHCAGMCGGIVAAMNLVASRIQSSAAVAVTPALAANYAGSPLERSAIVINAEPILFQANKRHATGFKNSANLHRVFSFNLGRIVTYTVLGALAGGVGTLGFLLDRMLPVQQAALVLANTVLVLMGLYVFGVPKVVRLLEQLGRPVWRKVQPLAVRAIAKVDYSSSWSVGLLWGLVPCGMVYTVLIAAMTTADPINGALLMAAFGAGTLPNLVLMGLSVTWLAQVKSHPWVRRSVGLLFVLVGVIGLLQLNSALNIPLLRELCFRPV